MEGEACTSLADETTPNPVTGINQQEEEAADAIVGSLAGVKNTMGKFRRIHDILSKCHTEWTQEWVQEITVLVLEIPYLPDNIRDNILNILQNWQRMNVNACKLAPAVAISSSSRVDDQQDVSLESYMDLLDETERNIVNLIPRDQQLAAAKSMAEKDLAHARVMAEKDLAHARVIAEKDRALAEKDCVIVEVISEKDLLAMVSRMHESIAKVHHSLHALAQMSQGERTMQSNMNSASKKAAEACLPKNYDCAGTLFSKEVTNLVAAKDPLQFDLRIIQEAANGSEQGLQNIAGAWKASIDGIKEQTSKCSATRDQFLAWMRNKIKKPDSTKPPPPFPDVMSDEVAGTQPALETLLMCIADLFNEDCAPHSPPKSQVKKGQIITKSDHRPKRIVDLSMNKAGQFKLLMLDHSLSLVLEVKPLLRKNETLESLHHQSFEQTLGHLAKSVYQGLNLFGIGTSTFATGITGNLAYISVYKLELIMKTADANGSIAELKLYVSDRLPLMTESCFDKWTKNFLGKNTEEEINKLKCELYGTVVKENDGGTSAENIPLGIWVLWDLMKKPHQDLFGPNYKELFFGKDSSNELLGSGSFSVIFSFQNGERVLKVGIGPSAAHIENELSILRKLGREQKDIESDELGLSILNDVLDLPFVLGGVRTSSKGLVLSPRGIGIQSFCRTVDELGPFLDRTIPTLVGALKFIHEKGICHNDVSPKNIIVHNERALLVDFGCASHKETTLEGFVGTPRYAHVSVFRNYPGCEWKPKGEYDFFSLGLSLSWLVLLPGQNWNMGRFPVSLTDDNEKELNDLDVTRVDLATALAQKSPCCENTKEIWMQCLKGYPERKRKCPE